MGEDRSFYAMGHWQRSDPATQTRARTERASERRATWSVECLPSVEPRMERQDRSERPSRAEEASRRAADAHRPSATLGHGCERQILRLAAVCLVAQRHHHLVIAEENGDPPPRPGSLRPEPHQELGCAPCAAAPIEDIADLHQLRLAPYPPLARIDQPRALQQIDQRIVRPVQVSDHDDSPHAPTPPRCSRPSMIARSSAAA